MYAVEQSKVTEALKDWGMGYGVQVGMFYTAVVHMASGKQMDGQLKWMQAWCVVDGAEADVKVMVDVDESKRLRAIDVNTSECGASVEYGCGNKVDERV